MGKELEGQPAHSGSGRTLSRGDSVNRGREVTTLVQLEHRTCAGTRGPGAWRTGQCSERWAESSREEWKGLSRFWLRDGRFFNQLELCFGKIIQGTLQDWAG